MAPALPVGERRLRHVAVSWAALRQAVACQYLRICGIEAKAQGCVENLVFDRGGDGGQPCRSKQAWRFIWPLLRPYLCAAEIFRPT